MNPPPFEHSCPLFSTIHALFETRFLYEDNEEVIHHGCRVELEKPVFDILRQRYGCALRHSWETGSSRFPTSGSAGIFLYETRCHENLEFLLYNLRHFAPTLRLFFFCTPDVRNFVEGLLGAESAATISFFPVPTSTQSEALPDRNMYNDYMKSCELWTIFKEAGVEHVLVAQTDAYLRRPLPLEHMMELDWAASFWPWDKQSVGGGGLSWRRVSKMS